MKKKKLPRDTNQLAKSIVDMTTGGGAEESEGVEDTPANYDGKDPAAVALGRKGGKVGGKARAAKLSKEERSAIAKKAAAARWKDK